MNTEWIVVQPPVYQRGDLYETQSVECGYTPDYLFQATYSDGSTRTVECDGFGILAMSDVKPEGYQASAMTDAVIGSCVEEIGRYAFSYCDGLTSINIPDNVRYIDLNAFAGLKNLKTVHIGKGVCYIESCAFNGCDGLDSITIEAITPPVLDDEFGNNWFNDTNNCPIYVPCQSLNAYKTASGWSQYADRIFGIPPCTPDIKFILTYSDGSTFTKYCNEYSYIFGSEVMEGGQKSEITEIFIGSCVKGIGMNAFNGVCKLKRVNSNVDGVMNIPEGVLELGENAFTWTCSSCHITSIILPSTLQRLSLDAFDSISCHQTLTINAVTPPYMNLDEYEYFPNPIYVPANSVESYKSASGWSHFADRIFPIT